ncbi:hypothetical protein, variant [Blastomyces dermatitidis ATCC 26199]|nr:hypothetical protein BDFG_07583 [Blastomyces dermatitidis ATCC 26199]EQL29900.1 hypothetical protein, variant [Blastomyces dermatitidis ATCC 26199]
MMAPTNTPTRQSNALGRAPQSAGIRSVSRTPRFIFGSTAPSSSASQFAAIPRFRFAEKFGQVSVSDIEADLSDIAPSSSALADSDGRIGSLPLLYSREDEIQDSNSDEEEILFHDDPTSSPLEGHSGARDDAGGFDSDAEIDSIFPPTPERRNAKRRRVSSPALNNPNADPISSCPSHPSSSPSSLHPPSPVSSLASLTTPSRALAPEPFTPLLPSITTFNRPPSSSTKHPRFLFRHQQSSPSMSTHFAPSQLKPTTAPISSQRRPPHFILPPTSSRPPEHLHLALTADERSLIPGRSRRSNSTTPICVPGGMTASVRGWLLEAEAAKHASQFQNTQASAFQAPRVTQEMPPPPRVANYYLVAEVVDVQHQASTSKSDHNTYTPGHPTPVTLITTTPINNSSTAIASSIINTDTNSTTPSTVQQQTSIRPPFIHPPSRKILLFGAPISNPPRSHSRGSFDTPGQHPGRHPRLSASFFAASPIVAKGDKIGLRRGLVWEMEIEEFPGRVGNGQMRQDREGAVDAEDVAGSASAPGTRRRDVKVEKWLVGVEWDVL